MPFFFIVSWYFSKQALLSWFAHSALSSPATAAGTKSGWIARRAASASAQI